MLRTGPELKPKLSQRISTNFQKLNFNFWKSMQFFDDIFSITSFSSNFEGFNDNIKKF
jgi:hypothetical protein